MIAYGIIPARLASTRLPRKLLLKETSKPLLQYTWEAAIRAKRLSEVIVATDSEEIQRTVTQFGGRAEMTGEHNSGTDRIAEVARRCSSRAEVFVNIQGDEPELEPGVIDLLVKLLEENPNAEMATLATPFKKPRGTGIDFLRESGLFAGRAGVVFQSIAGSVCPGSGDFGVIEIG